MPEASNLSAFHKADQRQQDDGTNRGADDMPGDTLKREEGRQKKSRNNRTENSDDDIADARRSKRVCARPTGIGEPRLRA